MLTVLFFTTMKLILFLLSLLLIGCSFQSDSNNFTKEEIEYFTEIALGAEFGDETPVIKKWNDCGQIKNKTNIIWQYEIIICYTATLEVWDNSKIPYYTV